MKYVVSIDWLSLFCEYKENSAQWVGATSTCSRLFEIGPWQYKIEEYGTRHYKHLCRVSYPNEYHGYDEFAEVQYEPCSSIIGKISYRAVRKSCAISSKLLGVGNAILIR